MRPSGTPSLAGRSRTSLERDVVYFDYQASTPIDRRVLDAMLPFLARQYADPTSPHQFGRLAAEALLRARRQVRAAIGACLDSEIVFTSGATEANLLALLGTAARAHGAHVVTTAIEHPSVLAGCAQLVAAGNAVTRVGVDSRGMVHPDHVAAAITPRTLLVSIGYANHEIGTVQPISDIAAVTRAAGVLLHVDAAQAIGAIPIDVECQGIDLLSISAHKIYGPKGVGALYVRRGTPLRPQQPGTQEHGLRGGAVNVAGAVGLGEALRLLTALREQEAVRVAGLRDRLAIELLSLLPDAHVNGGRTARMPGNLSVTIPGVTATDLIAALPELAVSTGSTRVGDRDVASHVLTAIGLDEAAAGATIRLSLGRFTKEDEISYAAYRIAAVARQAHRVLARA